MRLSFFLILIILLLGFGCTSRSKQRKLAMEKSGVATPKSANTLRSEYQAVPPPIVDRQKHLEPKTVSELFKDLQDAVFFVYATDQSGNGSQGSGFFINSRGVGITNYHVLSNNSYYQIQTTDGQRYNIKEILDSSPDDEYDYVVFQIEKTSRKFNYLPIARINNEIGEEVFAIGNPRGLESTLSKGIISAYRDNNKLIQTTTEITHGSSGGPLINMQGQVIGITTSGIGEANLNFAINIEVIDTTPFQ